ncbi:MAG: hypothetical protein AAF611_14870 [Bacteroidota bacterium]
MKKRKLTKLSLRKSRVAHFNKIYGGGTWDYPVDVHTTRLASEVEDGEYKICETASCLAGDPGDDHFISKGGGCPSIDPNNGQQVPFCAR